MKPKTVVTSIIAVSIVFAAAITLCSFLLKDSGYSQTVTYVLVALWWIPFTYLLTASTRSRSD